MSNGTVVRIAVRPAQRSHLAFDVEGVLGELNVDFGDSVSAFDFAAFYSGLGATVAGAPAELQYDSGAIAGAVTGASLMALRAESRKAALDKAIAARANAYYAKYANQAGIIAQMIQSYASASPGSKPTRLADLAAISQNQANLLQGAYTIDGRLGVVRSTTSALVASTTSVGDATSTDTTLSGGSNVTTGSSTTHVSDTDNSTTTSSGHSGSNATNDSAVTTGTQTGTDTATSSGTALTFQDSQSDGDTVTVATALENQAITNTSYDYRVPSLESLAQNERSQISLIDESFAQFMANQSLPYLSQVFGNELSILDLGVKELQVAYLDTILMSPIDGVVTGVYKRPGERVRRGDVVLRVEDNRSIFLVGTLVHRGPIGVGDTVTLHTTRFSDPADTVSITGTVVGARGQRSNDDWWTVVVSCSNLDGAGNPIFPLHYHFDFDDTTVTIS